MMGTDSMTMPGRSKPHIPSPERKRDAAKRPAPDVDGFSDDYLSVVAHDLRGTLNSIIGWAELIKRQALNEAGNVRAGETIIIGGLMQTRREKVESGVPGLRSIPLLGRLFTTTKDVERKAELVIFLTPTIIAGQPPVAR